MEVAIYLRKSRADSDAEDIMDTLSRHKTTLLEFAKKNQLTILKVYQEVVSGDSLVGRPQMLELLQDVESKIYSGVLCMDIDRLGRGNMRDMGIILETFKEADTKIITPRKIYNLNDDLDEFSTEIQSLVARQELKNIVRRMQQGVKRSASEGYHVAEPPYGYRREYINKKPTLKIEPQEAEIVRLIFDMYNEQGMGSHGIADALNRLGIKPRKGEHFSRNTVRWMLNNPIYIGKIYWNRNKRVKGKSKYIPNPVDQWIEADGLHPPIIDIDAFNKAQDIRKTRTHPPSNTGELKNPLAGIMRCANCGTTMIRQHQKHRKYQVPRLLCPTTACCRSTRIDAVEETLIDSLRQTLAQYKVECAALTETRPAQINNYQQIIKRLNDDLSTIITQRGKLFDLLEQGVYDIPTFTERNKLLFEREKILKAEIDGLNAKIDALSKQDYRVVAVPRLEQLLQEYWYCDASERNALLKSVVARADYKKDSSQFGSKFSLIIHMSEDF